MGDNFLTLDDLPPGGKTVLLRVDINSSLNPETGALLDDTRIRRHAATVELLADAGAKVAILAHQSRPGLLDCAPLKRHARRLAHLLDRPVEFIPDIHGELAQDAIRGLQPGEVVMLDNVRFDPEEVAVKAWDGKGFAPQANTALVRNLAPLGDIFVNDAFASAHRCQPSLVGFTEALPMVTGLVMERELRKLGGAIADGPAPRIALLGGSKAADSVAIAHHFLSQGVDEVLTGGVVANLFLMAGGVDIGEPSTAYIRDHIADWEQVVSDAGTLRKEFGDRLMVPVDVAVSDGGLRHGLPVSDLPTKHPVHDIGLETLVTYLQHIEGAGTVIANGPMGVFENPEFAAGTREIFTAMANSDALTVVGGGETAMAFTQMGLADRVNHVSTGGGACIAFMSGQVMPVLEALRHSKRRFDEGGYNK